MVVIRLPKKQWGKAWRAMIEAIRAAGDSNRRARNVGDLTEAFLCGRWLTRIMCFAACRVTLRGVICEFEQFSFSYT